MAFEQQQIRLAELAYELALRALDHQDALLDELRARTGTLLAAASIVTSFLGATAIDRAGLGPLGISALLAFITSIGASLYVLLPKRSLVVSLSGPVLIEQATQQNSTSPRRTAISPTGRRSFTRPTWRSSTACSLGTESPFSRCSPKSAYGRRSLEVRFEGNGQAPASAPAASPPPGPGITETGERTGGSKDASPRQMEEVLDAIPGSYERARAGLEQARTGQTIPLDELRSSD